MSSYVKVRWKNFPNLSTPLMARNLNHMDDEIFDLRETTDEHFIDIETLKIQKVNQNDFLTAVKDIYVDTQTGVITITKEDNSTYEFDTVLEKVAVNVNYDDDPTSAHYKSLILTLEDGTIKYVDLSAMIATITFSDTATIAHTQNGDNHSFSIKNGSITSNLLDQDYLASITTNMQLAEGYATSARNSASSASSSETTAITKAGEAASSAESAAGSATTALNCASESDDNRLDSEAWAKGTRDGVPVTNTDPTFHNNSKYWAEQSSGRALGDLSDVDIDETRLQNGQIIAYNSVKGGWINPTASSGFGPGTMYDDMPLNIGDNTVTGTGASSIGYNNTSSGSHSFSEGYRTSASGEYSHAEGGPTNQDGANIYTHASGRFSHAEGSGTYASGVSSHSEGDLTEAEGNASHAEGARTKTTTPASHAEGFGNAFENFYTSPGKITGSSSTIFSMEKINRDYGGDIIEPGYEKQYNKNIIHMIGNGSDNQVFGGLSNLVRDNALAMDGLGNLYLAGSPFIRRGVIEGQLIANTTHNFALEPGAMYLLFCYGNMISNGAWRGMNTYVIGANYGIGTTTSGQRGGYVSTWAQGSTPVSLTFDNRTSTYEFVDPITGEVSTRYCYGVGIGSCTTDIRVRYSLIKVLGSYRDFSLNHDANWHSDYPENEGKYKVEVYDIVDKTETHNREWCADHTPLATYYYDTTNVKKSKPWGTPSTNYCVRITQYVYCKGSFNLVMSVTKTGLTEGHIFLNGVEVAESGTGTFLNGWNKVELIYTTIASSAYYYLTKDLFRINDITINDKIIYVYPKLPSGTVDPYPDPVI